MNWGFCQCKTPLSNHIKTTRAPESLPVASVHPSRLTVMQLRDLIRLCRCFGWVRRGRRYSSHPIHPSIHTYIHTYIGTYPYTPLPRSTRLFVRQWPPPFVFIKCSTMVSENFAPQVSPRIAEGPANGDSGTRREIRAAAGTAHSQAMKPKAGLPVGLRWALGSSG
jgi:hypothetical protein